MAVVSSYPQDGYSPTIFRGEVITLTVRGVATVVRVRSVGVLEGRLVIPVVDPVTVVICRGLGN